MRLLLLSEDPVAMDELEAKLQQQLPALRVIGKCYTWSEGIQAAQRLQPDVVLIDYEKQLIKPQALFQLRESCQYLLALTSPNNDKFLAVFDCHGDIDALLHFLSQH
ncbi:MAG: hypothetical protein K9J37_19655 [Saprospiraceae bacterium]|nr:hypothetical protein [Saprospiraceae bacterium]MCF8252142.1 hypothetical protein [Saprospiraceae bacterium]MCF8282449.1 hypothetical protein [Bacteroidales bacterium]MCF8313811.1 hypothetical protein [Saprospiraceae bacterium]MCF8442517.1 hypothetical protein [Saprospiraceae bacterium]